MAKKIMILAGAPDESLLDWGSGGLLTEFQDPISKFAGLGGRTTASWPTNADRSGHSSSTPCYAVWRSLPLHRVHVSTGFSQQHDMQLVDAFPGHESFFTTTDASFQSLSDSGGLNGPSVLTQFYEHSLAVHDDLPSSQLMADVSEETREDTWDTDKSVLTDMDEASKVSVRLPLAGHSAGHLSDLEDIPNAAYLRSIEPQTMTVNLVAGIISIAAPRTVKTRWGTTKSLVEVLIGDETKSGFSVTFWLLSDTVARSQLAGLRPQDVILVQNVALNAFVKKVYGHSLRKDLTKVHLLYRRRLDSADVGGYYTAADLAPTRHSHPQLEKTRRVREWVMRFVGGGPGHRSGSGHDTTPAWNRPPPDDTQ